MPTYTTHDNGGRPFLVTKKGMDITVLKNMDTFERKGDIFVDIHKEPKLIMDITVDEFFVGKKSPTGGYDGLSPRDAEGNSLLFKKGTKYIFVGHEIYQFAPVKGDTIVKYYSDIGNSDVPYPYAIGKTHVYILLEDKVAVEKSFFDMKQNIYDQFYYADSRLPMCLKGGDSKNICKDTALAKERIQELKKKSQKLKSKMLHKRL
jgi:hypothetical protein